MLVCYETVFVIIALNCHKMLCYKTVNDNNVIIWNKIFIICNKVFIIMTIFSCCLLTPSTNQTFFCLCHKTRPFLTQSDKIHFYFNLIQIIFCLFLMHTGGDPKCNKIRNLGIHHRQKSPKVSLHKHPWILNPNTSMLTLSWGFHFRV